MTAGTLLLADFLLARIDEDEYAAGLTYATCFVGTIEGNGSRFDLAVLMSPARVLAECEAKRRIVEQWRESQVIAESDDGGPWAEGMAYAGDIAMCDLAAVYAGHPDYRSEWRP